MTTDTKNISKSGSTLTDVPYDLAYQAHYASSFSPKKEHTTNNRDMLIRWIWHILIL